MKDRPQDADGMPYDFYAERNGRTRIDVFSELTTTAGPALRQFFRGMGAPHYMDEVLLPTLELGDARVFCAVRDRPWPPWGLGARTVSAVCEVHSVAPDSWAPSPVFLVDEELANVGLACAVYKEVLEALAVSETAEVCYLAAEGSVLADHVLRSRGMRRDEDVVLTERARYFTYRVRARQLLESLSLHKLSTPDLLAHDLSSEVLESNALFHHGILAAARADLRLGLTPEIIGLGRGGHAAKPAGVPGGTGTGLGTDQFGLPDDEFPYVSLGSFLGQLRGELLEQMLERREAFEPAKVHPEDREGPVVDERLRRGLTLRDVGFIEKDFVERLKGALPPALERLGGEGFPVGRIELQISASGDGDYYRMHRDTDATSSRELSFVYFFHREPRGFSGGELRIYDDRRVRGQAHADSSHLLSPRQDMLVLFPSRFAHELLPVRVPSQQFADSRFTVNGWIHRASS